MTTTEPTLLTNDDIYLFNEGRGVRLYDVLGAHFTTVDGKKGVYFAVWAPNAESVSVVGDFNYWNNAANPLRPRQSSGIWEGFVPGLEQGTVYKYHIESRVNGYKVDKADPFGFRAETPPRTASMVWDLDYAWQDSGWMTNRRGKQTLQSPVSIYELHLGSWRRIPEEGNRSMTYREIAAPLAEHMRNLGFTHVELLPIMEHPFYGSWGYQSVGYFAPTSRYGTPQDFMYLVDYLHQQGIGVILDWVPSHFATDEHGLGNFDGTHLFEHASQQQGYHPDWGSYIFNYGRNEVRSFLLSSAMFWLDKYHIDGIRVDAVASMLYLDYSRKAGEWTPNQYGGRENIEAINFLRALNEDTHLHFPDTITIAEESTAWPMVSRPTYLGGLGFDLKWDMGWMHDTLRYFSFDPIYRRFHHSDLTFRALYAFNENFTLPLSHDEVVHGKGSLLGKMPGDEWQKFANLRLLYASMYGQPGKKLLFMGAELAVWDEWGHEKSVDWHLGAFARHSGIAHLLGDLNAMYRNYPALHEKDVDSSGFQWLNADDAEESTLTFLRRGKDEKDVVVCAYNFTPLPRYNYRIGVPNGGHWREVLNTDAEVYGGTSVGNFGGVEAAPVGYNWQQWSLMVTLPPLGAVFFAPESESEDASS
jgi:1,4-alpha-glucan branching enzyme